MISAMNIRKTIKFSLLRYEISILRMSLFYMDIHIVGNLSGEYYSGRLPLQIYSLGNSHYKSSEGIRCFTEGN